MPLKHLDLFSGIGGFALAVDRVFGEAEHVFCDNDLFCQSVLKKHWPTSKIYGDIRTLTNTGSIESGRLSDQRRQEVAEAGRSDILGTFTNAASGKDDQRERGIMEEKERQQEGGNTTSLPCDILTGGFPCQPFSVAGQRKGTADDRYLWPEMLRVIQEFRPRWIIAENVRGIINWSGGLVFEQVHLDLEGAGYKVQPFIIPACGVNAPHRRERVWFVAHRHDAGSGASESEPLRDWSKNSKQREDSQSRNSRPDQPPHSNAEGGRAMRYSESGESDGEEARRGRHNDYSWERNWVEVASELCGMDDGLPAKLDGHERFHRSELSPAGHRNARLKALGNAIVPQVAEMILKSICLCEE